MKKLLTGLCALALVLVCVFVLPTTAEASAIGKGTCGEKLKWSLDSSGILTISGNGFMDNWEGGDAPWYAKRGSIKKITIGSGVKSIGSCAFYDCDKLTSVTIPRGVKEIGRSAFAWCDGIKSVKIGNGVTTIGSAAFQCCPKLSKVTIGKNVTVIEDYAFSFCPKIASVVIPEGVTTISQSLFNGCYALSSVTIPKTVTNIDVSAFNSCSKLTSVKIPNGVTTIGDYAFAFTKLTSVKIPNSVTTVGSYAFQCCSSLKKVTIGKGVTSIGYNAFVSSSALTSIQVDAKNKCYSNDKYGVLFNKKKTVLICAPGGISGSYKVPAKVTAIDDFAFSSCTKLTSVTIPEGVITIGKEAFYCCKKLKTVTIPNSVTTIGKYAFDFCTIVSNVYYSGNRTQWKAIAIGAGNKNLTKAKIHYRNVANIATQPKETAVAKNKTAKVTIKAEGDGLKYQWYYAAKGTSKFKKISGATKATYSVKMTSEVDGRQVYCVVKDKYGNEVKSKTVTLTVKKVAKITTQPKSVKVAKNKTAKVTIKATGDGLKYTWYYKNDGTSKFKKSSVDEAKYSVKMTSKVDGRKVYCKVTDTYGNTVKSKTVTLKMK